MNLDSLDRGEFSQLWPNVMSMIILGIMTVSLLAMAPWGIDVLYSGLTHFLILWPLLLLAILTYITKEKLAEEEKEIPSW